MNKAILITTTFEKEEDAERIARLLLEKRLVACAHISALGKSLYWWEGKINEAMEYQLNLKSLLSRYSEIETIIRAEHPYRTPEIIATEFIAGSREYLAWLREELQR